MQVVAHLINDIKEFEYYFRDDAKSPEIMRFIEDYTSVIFKGPLTHTPSAFALLDVSGNNVEAAVVMDIMDLSNLEVPVLHLILQATIDFVTLPDDHTKIPTYS